jgi:hypothetical protein
LKTFLQVSLLVYNGWKVFKLTDVQPDVLYNLARNAETCAHNYPAFIVELLDATQDFNEQQFNRVLQKVTGNIGLQNCMTHVAYPLLEKVKFLWATGTTMSAQELFSTCVLHNKIIAETSGISMGLARRGTMVLFTPDVEYYNLDLLFINYLLKESGWKTIFFGNNVNWRTIQTAVNNKSVSAVYIHLVTALTPFEIDDYLETVCKAFSEKQIIASGDAVHAAQRNFLNLRLLKSDASIYSFIKDDCL